MTSRLEWSYNGGVVTKFGSGRGYEFVSKQLGYGSGIVTAPAKPIDIKVKYWL